MMSPSSGPGPDFVHYEPGFYSGHGPGFYPFLSMGPSRGPDFIRSCPDPDFIKHARVQVCVRILPTPPRAA